MNWTKINTIIDSIIKKGFEPAVKYAKSEREYTAHISGIIYDDYISWLKEFNTDYKAKLDEILNLKEPQKYLDDLNKIKIKTNNLLVKQQPKEYYLKKYKFNTSKKVFSKNEVIYYNEPEQYYDINKSYKQFIRFLKSIIAETKGTIKEIKKRQGRSLLFNIDTNRNRKSLNSIHKELTEKSIYLDCKFDDFLNAIGENESGKVIDWKSSYSALKFFVSELCNKYLNKKAINHLRIAEQIFTIKGSPVNYKSLKTAELTKVHSNRIKAIFK